MALRGEVFELAGIGRPLAGLGLLAAGKVHLAEQDFAELLRAAHIEFLARRLVGRVFEPRHALLEIS